MRGCGAFRRNAPRVLATIVLFASGGEALLHAQATVRIDQECRSDSWALQPLLSFGSEPAVGLSYPQESLLLRPGGGAVLFNDGRLHWYDRAGRLEKSIGRQGQGPGEFQGAQALRFLRSGDLEVYDSRNMQKTVIGPAPDLAVKQVTRLRTPVAMSSTLFLPDGRIVTNGDFAAPPHTGLPIHMLATDGAIARSFGKLPPERRTDVAFPLMRSLSWAGGDFASVWSAHLRRYRIERWDLAGNLLNTIERGVSWFAPWELDGPITPQSPMPPHVRAVQEIAPGRLAVLLAVAPPGWQRGLEQRGTNWEVTRIDQILGGRLEILDIQRGCLVTTLDIAGYPLRLFAEGVVAMYREDDDTGEAAVVFHRLVGPTN